MSEESDKARYIAAAHAMQAGVAWELTALKDIDAESVVGRAMKHLRVGINSAMSDHGALVFLLVEKGIFTTAEYLTHMADFMEREVEMYNNMVREHTGHDGITFG